MPIYSAIMLCRGSMLLLYPLVCILLLPPPPAAAQQGEASAPTHAASAEKPAAADKPIPPIPELLHDVEEHQKEAEAAQRDYTYHVHLELQQLDHSGRVKKIITEDSESITIDGIRIEKVVARNGKPLTPEQAQKESDRIDKEVARAKARRERLSARGESTDENGNPLIPVSRILELGSFSNPRRVLLDNRPSIALDYAGDPHAKIRNPSEGIIRNLVGTIWIDEQNRVLVRGQGHFLQDFKIGAGLILNIHKGLSFDFRATHISGNVWLPATIDGEGNARVLLFDHIDGKFRLVTSNYQRFTTSVTIMDSNRLVNPSGPAAATGAAPGQPLPPQALPQQAEPSTGAGGAPE
ncbi:MAG: hypothetical protein ACP5E5_10455 [Acidobacteriaceae bacterium]